MHLCVVNPHYIERTIGGAEVQIYFLAVTALKKGWRVSYVTQPNEIPEKTQGINFYPFKNNTSRFEDGQNAMIKLLKEIGADVYYQRGRKMWTAYVGAFAAATGAPFVYGVSMDIDCYESKVGTRSKRTDGLRRLRKILSGRKIEKLDKATLKGMTQATLILAQSHTQKGLLKKNLELESIVFPNLHPVPKQKVKNGGEIPQVLWLASVKKWKRPEIFIDMARKLRNARCRFVLAGRLVDRELSSLIDKAQRELPNFTYHSDVSFERSNELLAESDILVNTSHMEEGFPNTYIQAWLREVPTIALGFDPDGVITKKVIGANAQSEEELYQQLRDLIENSRKRIDMGKRGREYAIRQHGLNENSERLFSLFGGAALARGQQ